MTVFIVFIVTLSVKLMSQDSSMEHSDYYMRGIHHDEQMEMERRAAPYKDSIQIDYSGSKLNITLPKSLELPIQKLKIQLYRPSDSDLDQYIKVEENISEPDILLSVEELVKGNWQARISWQDKDGNAYYVQKFMFVH